MKIILLIVLLPFVLKAQTVKAIVSKQFITTGEPFSIQYILEDFKKDDEFIPPAFKGFRIISGPYTYNGSITSTNGSKPLKNIFFTLVATRPGRFIISGPAVKVNNKFIKSGNIVIDVVAKQEVFEKSGKNGKDENASEYFLQPGEDPYEKMRQNLFMKVMVDKRSCYVGQPVVATFKLYSRLESKSDIVKNPGFYGFTVQDIINLNDNVSGTETVGGKPFDVHTVRTVQLYPLQPGIFTIDAMEVINKVEFSKSIVNKKTEQKIMEGVVEDSDPPARDNTVSYENNISTEKITIHVKPYPLAKKAETFNGATGNFSLHASLEKNELAKNEEGTLIITIAGKGNFTQLSAPPVQWPKGIEVFEPEIKDSLDKTQVPLKGSRTFRFPFIAGEGGEYTIPAVSLTFFDPDSNNYKTVSAAVPVINISKEEIKEQPKKQQTILPPGNKNDNSTIWLYGSIFLAVVVIILLQLRKPKKEEPVKETLSEKTEAVVSIGQLLQPVQFSLVADDGQFYTLLQKTIWDHLGRQLNLSGSTLNKDDLYKALKEKNKEEQCRNILDILQECEAAVFTKAELVHDKQELLNRAKMALEQIRD